MSSGLFTPPGIARAYVFMQSYYGRPPVSPDIGTSFLVCDDERCHWTWLGKNNKAINTIIHRVDDPNGYHILKEFYNNQLASERV